MRWEVIVEAVGEVSVEVDGVIVRMVRGSQGSVRRGRRKGKVLIGEIGEIGEG